MSRDPKSEEKRRSACKRRCGVVDDGRLREKTSLFAPIVKSGLIGRADQPGLVRKGA
jgi:hypothetical protein